MKQFAVAVALTLLLAPAALAFPRNISFTNDSEQPVTSCDQLSVRFDGADAVRATEQLPVANFSSLKVNAARNGGVYVTGGSGYAVTVCKAADSQLALAQVHASVAGNQVTADGPLDESWIAYFIVTVPRNASLNVDSTNGPIALRDVDGNITAHATNGPIAVRQSTGTIDVETKNGPISLTGGSGTVKLNATNGPISVRLDGAMWKGNLEAQTHNGPLSVRIPRDFLSGTVIEGTRGPVSCHAEACRNALRDFDRDDEPRRIEFGSGPTVVHMSTINGPISVKEQ